MPLPASKTQRVALVTGAASGIGRAIALAWAREGVAVVVSDTQEVGGRETVAMAQAAGAPALFVVADVARPGDCEALVAQAVARFGRLDMACNNAVDGGYLAR